MRAVGTGGLWELNDRPSLRFVRDALRMRRHNTVEIVFEVDDVALAPSNTLTAQAPSSASSPANAASSSDSGSSVSSVDVQSPTADAASNDSTAPTIGELMAAKQAAAEAKGMRKSDVVKRMERRAAYLEQVGQRNDSPYLAGAVALFVLPSLVILGWAYFSGYLDHIYSLSVTIK